MTAPLILFLGKPGSGKGTQAVFLAEKTGYDVFKMSDELRKLGKTHPDFGQKIILMIEAGDLVPHWIVTHLWLGRILSAGAQEGIVFDGAVRRLEEATLLHEVTAWLARPYKVFFLNVSDEEMQQRIGKRATIEGRNDDSAEALTERMQEYDKHTAKSLEFFKSQNTYVEINGEGSIEEIHERVMDAFTKEFGAQ